MKESTNRRYWQRMSRFYAAFMRSAAPMYGQICDRYRPHLSQDMRLLELACGSGQFARLLGETVRHWEATDYAEGMIAEARKQPVPSPVRFSVCDATRIPHPTGGFDAVLIGNALHIMPDPRAAMQEIHRVLVPGGLLMAPTFIWGTDPRQHIGEWLLHLTGFEVYQKWTASELADFVTAHGFDVLENRVMGGSIRPLGCLLAVSTRGVKP